MFHFQSVDINNNVEQNQSNCTDSPPAPCQMCSCNVSYFSTWHSLNCKSENYRFIQEDFRRVSLQYYNAYWLRDPVYNNIYTPTIIFTSQEDSTIEWTENNNEHKNPKQGIATPSPSYAFNGGEDQRPNPGGKLKSSYKCDLCGDQFKRRASLIRHRRTHTGERPYQCDTCRDTFSQIANLNYHKRIHSNEMPFICRECGKSFRSSSHLKRHFRIHSGEKPYVCPFCQQSFSSWDRRKRHTKMHSSENVVH